MQTLSVILILTVLFLAAATASAQVRTETAEDEFSRSLGQGTVSTSRNSPIKKVSKKTQTTSRGMKMSFEKQEMCKGEFNPVPSTSEFVGGDCMRVKFKLNFNGYLTIINLGTSGKNEVIYSANRPDARVNANTDYFVPDGAGWEFDENPGIEHFVFLLSTAPLREATIRKYLKERQPASQTSVDFENYRDLRRRNQDNSVYFFKDGRRSLTLVSFRMMIRHR